MTLKSSKTAERLAQVLSILSFVLLCWVAHRSLEVRTNCIHSTFINFVQLEGIRVPNCRYESRLSLRALTESLTEAQSHKIRALEVLEPLKGVFPDPKRGIAVDVVNDHHLFELGSGYVRLGNDWLENDIQVRRALTMGLLRNEFPNAYTNQFQLETLADFFLLAVFDEDGWKDEKGEVFSLMRDMRFSTVAPMVEQYCLSPFRSLAHGKLCTIDGLDGQMNTWGFRPLLAVSLYRVFQKLSLKDQLDFMKSLRSGVHLPSLPDMGNSSVENLVGWFSSSLREYLAALLPRARSSDLQLAVKRTFKELEVEAPTHWELTLDLTSTPAWKDILEQLRQRAQFRKNERILVFTPEGARALPSGLPVAWAADEISSQKHVLIACNWPSPDETVHIRARHMFAQQTCGKLTRPFWD